MFLYPGAKLALLGRQTQPRMRAHDIICLHTMVGFLTSTDGYFRNSNGPGFDGTESHFGNGGKWGPDLGGHMDGQLFQWQDLMYTADANLDGNGTVISIEHADNAARPIAPFTEAQMDSDIELIAWLCTPEAHAGCPADWACHRVGIPPVAIPDTLPGRRGISWHSKGIPPNLVAGGVRWSNAVGKDCPTEARIQQIKTIIIPGVQRRLAGLPQEEEDSMAALTSKDIRDSTGGGVMDALRTNEAQGILARASKAGVAELTAAVNANTSAVRDLIAALAPPADPTT